MGGGDVVVVCLTYGRRRMSLPPQRTHRKLAPRLTQRPKKKADLPRGRPFLLRDELNLELEASANAEAAWFQSKDVSVQAR